MCLSKDDGNLSILQVHILNMIAFYLGDETLWKDVIDNKYVINENITKKSKRCVNFRGHTAKFAN